MIPQVGTWKATLTFAASLVAAVAQIQLAQRAQESYRQPYFILYLSHSFFMIGFPLHLAGLSIYTRVSPWAYIRGLRNAMQTKSSISLNRPASEYQFSVIPFLGTVGVMTAGSAVVGLLWLLAIPLASPNDVNAIFNTNAFWVYALSVWISGNQWQARPLSAIVIAVAGVMLIAYGGSGSHDAAAEAMATSKTAIGDALSLIASMLYSCYQIWYQRCVSIPSEETRNDQYQYLNPDEPSGVFHAGSPDSPDGFDDAVSRSEVVAVPPAFGLHSSGMLACVGLTTFLLLWPPIIVLHHTGYEVFQLPADWETWAALTGMCVCGVIANISFLVLVAHWGPIITSVGSLLTIVGVLVSDATFGHGADTLTIPSLLGAACISCAFAVLVIHETSPETRLGKEEKSPVMVAEPKSPFSA